MHRTLLEQYKDAIDLSSIVSKSDKYGNVTYVNDQFLKISKYSRDELMGKPHNILRHPDMPKAVFRDLWRTIKRDKKPWQGILKNFAKDKSVYWVKTLVMPLLDGEGKFGEFISIRTDITEVIEKEKRIEALLNSSRKFVPTDFLQLLQVTDISNLHSGMCNNFELTILFCDIRNFTQYSEVSIPKNIFLELNKYFAKMEPIIKSHNGFIDKYIGDAIMAIFYSAEEAIKASLLMQETLVDLNLERNQMGLPNIDFGIGINTGIVTLGTVGSGERLDTTVIGDTVNVAARVESLTKKTNSKILVTEQTLSDELKQKFS
ncbi:MAG: adenylate/guanylate cyclase domain-containing protein, partial [Spirochaetota bacterium]